MKLLSWGLRLSATDLANHLGCRHLTLLDRGVVEGRIQASKWRGFVPHTFRVQDFLAYYRWVKGRLESGLEQPFPT